jgi:GTP pyrophosphokinase
VAAPQSSGRAQQELRLAALLADVGVVLQGAALDAVVVGRVKSSASSRQKANRLGLLTFLPLDAIGIRVIVDNHEQCQEVIDLLQLRFQRIAAEYDDYIRAPKANGYSSLHTTLLNRDGGAFEVQVRTHEMHVHAEGGAASHGRYKQLQASAAPVASPPPQQGSQYGSHGSAPAECAEAKHD